MNCYTAEDFNNNFWQAMMSEFWDYSDHVDHWHIWYNMCESKEFSFMYCGA